MEGAEGVGGKVSTLTEEYVEEALEARDSTEPCTGREENTELVHVAGTRASWVEPQGRSSDFNSGGHLEQTEPGTPSDATAVPSRQLVPASQDPGRSRPPVCLQTLAAWGGRCPSHSLLLGSQGREVCRNSRGLFFQARERKVLMELLSPSCTSPLSLLCSNPGGTCLSAYLPASRPGAHGKSLSE